MFYDKCPVCDTKLEEVLNEKGFVIDWFCNKCGISWNLEDLEYEPIQKELDKWI